MSAHTIEFTLEPRWGVSAKVRCWEADGALCRTQCKRPECEDYCVDELLPVEEHVRVPNDRVHGGTYCNIVEWLEGDGPLELYGGKETSPRDGDIEPIWRDDHFEWRYAGEET